MNITPRGYRIGGQPAFLNSGEFPYFRVPREDWAQRMDRFRDAGGNTLGTYVPWLLHEPREGAFDFTGPGGRYDIRAFLDLAHRKRFFVMVRPGPYQFAELAFCGLASWLFERYPQVKARTRSGAPFTNDAISFLHPVFLKKTRNWFAAVCPLLAEYSASAGGPVVMAQVDNEIAIQQLANAGLDYHAETMEFGRADGRFARFLRDRFGSLEDVNRRYGLALADWPALKPEIFPASGEPAVRFNKDYYDFYCEHLAEYLARLCAWMREFGIDVPLAHNTVPAMHHILTETKLRLGADLMVGCDHYYNLDQCWAQNNPTPQWAVDIFASLETARMRGDPPTVFELPAGSLSDWPPVTGVDLHAAYMVNLAFGMKGLNYYVFTGGPNPPGCGTTGEVYDFGAPVAADGTVRDTYGTLRAFGGFLRQHAWLAEAESVACVRVGLDRLTSRSRSGYSPLRDAKNAWRCLQRGLLTTAFCNHLTPLLCDLDSDAWCEDTTTPLLVATGRAMSRAAQANLARFFTGGGKLLLAGPIPGLDEHLEPCRILGETLGVPREAPDAAPLHSSQQLQIDGVSNIYVNGELFSFPALPAGAAVLGRCGADHVTAWTVTGPRGARCIVCGLRWCHAKAEHGHMLERLTGRLGAEPAVRCSQPCIWTALRATEARAMLFVMNLTTAPMTGELACRPPWAGNMVELGSHTVPPMTVHGIDLTAGT